MKKAFVINLKSLEYVGDAIGNDIVLEIEVSGIFLKYDQKIKHGTRVEINREVGYFETEKTILELPISIRITEDDILFDDVGDVKGSVKIDLLLPLPQDTIFEVRVNEKRGSTGKRTGIFRVIIEVASAIRYAEDVDGHGWLRVRPDTTGEEFSIPVHLKVRYDTAYEGREYFIILEGVKKGVTASVSEKSDGTSRFSKINSHRKPVNLTYSLSKKTLQCDRKKYKTTDYPDAPWIKGVYDIAIPDYPHELGLRYAKDVSHATTWFRINHRDGDRYVHTGGISRGCITIIERGRWDELYAVLISARKDDGMHIGTLTVIN